MSAVVSAVTNVVSSVGDAVGSVVSGAADIASSVVDQVVTPVAKAVDNTIQAAVNDPVGTALKVAAVATGQPELIPLISAGETVASGGSLDQALQNAAVSYAVGQAGAGVGSCVAASTGSELAGDAAKAATIGLAKSAITGVNPVCAAVGSFINNQIYSGIAPTPGGSSASATQDTTINAGLPQACTTPDLPSGLQLAQADTCTASDTSEGFKVDIGGAPVYAESPNAGSVTAPFGYNLLSASQSDDKPAGSYYDFTQNAWFAPNQEVQNLQDAISGGDQFSGLPAQGCAPEQCAPETECVASGCIPAPTSPLDVLSTAPTGQAPSECGPTECTAGASIPSEQTTVVSCAPETSPLDVLACAPTAQAPSECAPVECASVACIPVETQPIACSALGVLACAPTGCAPDCCAPAVCAPSACAPAFCAPEQLPMQATGCAPQCACCAQVSCAPQTQTEGVACQPSCGAPSGGLCFAETCAPVECAPICEPVCVASGCVSDCCACVDQCTVDECTADQCCECCDCGVKIPNIPVVRGKTTRTRTSTASCSCTSNLASDIKWLNSNPELLLYKGALGKNPFGEAMVEPMPYAKGGLSFAAGGSDSLCNCTCVNDLTRFCKNLPKFGKCTAPELLFHKASSKTSPIAHNQLKQLMNQISPLGNMGGLAKGGLPSKYQEAAPEGHNPEFVTGLTGYYADGGGTGQSDDIPAMLHDGDYVMDAETVSALGDGSSKAGRKVLDGFRTKVPHNPRAEMGKVVPAKIADGEYVFPASFVTALGGGDNKRGAEILDGLREKLRAHKRAAPVNKIPPKAKSPLEYIGKTKG